MFLPGRGRLYGRASAAAFQVIREHASLVERASIDEAYLDVTDAHQDDDGGPIDIAARIQRAHRLGG